MDNKNSITVPAATALAFRTHRLFRGLLVVSTGFAKHALNPLPPVADRETARLVFCVDGFGWCSISGKSQTVRRGDLLIIPSNARLALGSRPSRPWTVHWVDAVGELVEDYLQELGTKTEPRLITLGPDPQLVRLFNEVLSCLRRGPRHADALLASHALAHLLALVIAKSGEAAGDVDSSRKVAEAIIYMSEHLDARVRIPDLARQANLSPAYFSELFKKQTGCAPRDYLHLLRIHRACELLRTSEQTIKEIACRVGYEDQFHFSRQFKAFEGVSPTEYRQSH